MDSPDGEILLKENYSCPSLKEIHYVKPAEQLNVVASINQQSNNMVGKVSRIFLPQGYPNSVSKDYLAYQIWDTAQAFCSTITGILATQEVLRGVGVGDTTASPLAATITWVIKDGCGHLGRIVFAYSHGSSLDCYSKKWRLFADTLNDAAMCIEIALPLFHSYTTFALCISTVMKSIVGVAGGATRVALTQHHAIRGNMGDVSAKDSAQETAVNLVASLTALLILTLFGNSLFIFLLMVTLHIIFNYFAVRAVCLRTLNEPRFLQVIDNYLKNENIATPCEINRSEPIVFYQMGSNLLDLKMCGYHIKLGQSLTKVIEYSTQASYLKKIKEIYREDKYIVVPNANTRTMYVFLKHRASVDDVLCAYFNAVLLANIAQAVSGDSVKAAVDTSNPRPFAKVCRAMQQAEWSRGPDSHEPPFEVLTYVRNIAKREWFIVKTGLLRTGWDLTKHLLMVDEWRVCDDYKTETMFPEGQDVTPTNVVMSPNSNEFLPETSSTPSSFELVPKTFLTEAPVDSKIFFNELSETFDDSSTTLVGDTEQDLFRSLLPDVITGKNE